MSEFIGKKCFAINLHNKTFYDVKKPTEANLIIFDLISSHI